MSTQAPNSLDSLPIRTEKTIAESVDSVRIEITNLETLLNANAPLGDCVIRIHKHLKETPELSSMLTLEEIMIQVRGLKSLKLSAILEGKGRKSVKSSYSDNDLEL